MERATSARHWLGLYTETGYLCAVRYGADGEVLERRRTESAAWAGDAAGAAKVLAGLCGDWLEPQTAWVGAGLSSLLPAERNPAPIELPLEVAAGTLPVRQVRLPGSDLAGYLLPDFSQLGLLPGRIGDGTAALLGIRAGSEAPDLLVGLLGAQRHQWIRLDRHRIRRFCDFMTPLLHDLLSTGASALTVPEDEGNWHAGAFDFGLAVARGEDRQAGLLGCLDSPQALVRSGQLQAAELGSFRHGLLIGHELLGLKRVEPDAGPDCPVILVGEEDPCLRFARALQLFGYDHVERARHAGERGLWQLTRALPANGGTVPG